MKQYIISLLVGFLLISYYLQPQLFHHTFDWCSNTSTKISHNISSFCEKNKSNIFLYTLTIFGSLLGPLFSQNGKCERTSVPFLRLNFPNKSETFYNRSDLFITIFVGSLLGYLTVQPTTATNAIIAGATWSVALSKISNLGPKSRPKSGDTITEKITVPTEGNEQ